MNNIDAAIHRAGILLLACLAAFLLAYPAMAADATDPQQITITVLDNMDRPVAGALVKAAARAGKPQSPGPWKSDEWGKVVIVWLPQRDDLSKGTKSEDKIYELKSEVIFTVSAPGYGAKTLKLGDRAKGQVMANPKLASLSKKAELRPLKEVVVLKKNAELLAGRLTGKDDTAKARKKCLAFVARNGQALNALGVTFASPAFNLQGDLLRLKVKLRGQAWGGLGRMPFKTRALMNAGLPLAAAVGREILPLPGVKRADIWVEGDEAPGGDKLAAPKGISVVLGANANAFVALGQGRIPPRKFVRENPAVTRHTGG